MFPPIRLISYSLCHAPMVFPSLIKTTVISCQEHYIKTYIESLPSNSSWQFCTQHAYSSFKLYKHYLNLIITFKHQKGYSDSVTLAYLSALSYKRKLTN